MRHIASWLVRLDNATRDHIARKGGHRETWLDNAASDQTEVLEHGWTEGSRAKVFQEVQQLVAQFAPTWRSMCAMADFEEASAARDFNMSTVYPNAPA